VYKPILEVCMGVGNPMGIPWKWESHGNGNSHTAHDGNGNKANGNGNSIYFTVHACKNSQNYCDALDQPLKLTLNGLYSELKCVKIK